MQNTVVVHVQSFAVFARPIVVAVVDISITTQERNKLEQVISREEVMKYLTDGIRQKSHEILIELLINKITIWDDHIEIEFNYSNNINPDEHENARRDFAFYACKQTKRANGNNGQNLYKIATFDPFLGLLTPKKTQFLPKKVFKPVKVPSPPQVF